MKVIFYNDLPFFLAHGGTQTFVESLMQGLRDHGVGVEPARWWDETQTGDVLHYINRPPPGCVQYAERKGFKQVMTESLDMTASRPPLALWVRQMALALDRSLFGIVNRRMGLEIYQRLDAAVYITELEARVAQRLYRAPPERCRVIPHALTAEALDDLARPQAEEDFLITTATIAPRKNTVLLAEAARHAQVPVVFLGKPYSEQDSYFRQFKDLVDGRYVRYPGFVSSEEKHRLLRGARGFVLLSEFETGCISVYEAAAAGLPLLLSDLPWANQVYHQARHSRFVSLGSVRRVAKELRAFYLEAHRQPTATFPIRSWREIAGCYLELYQEILRR